MLTAFQFYEYFDLNIDFCCAEAFERRYFFFIVLIISWKNVFFPLFFFSVLRIPDWSRGQPFTSMNHIVHHIPHLLSFYSLDLQYEWIPCLLTWDKSCLSNFYFFDFLINWSNFNHTWHKVKEIHFFGSVQILKGI